MKIKNILSLFAGMEVGRIAFDLSNKDFNNFYSSEIEPAAVNTVKDNYQDITHMGDVTNWRDWDIDWASIDLVMGGSPCQGFSRVGKELNFDDPRSALFFVYVDILNHIKALNPNVKFMLENVDMKQEWIDVISGRLGVKPVMVDAKYFTAQSRPRWFWANWEISQDLPEQKTIKEVLGFNAVGCSRRARYINGKNGKTYQKLEVRKDGLANCMTTVSKNCKLIDDKEERNITIDEGCIFQGIPLGYFKNTKKTHAMKMLGNAWNALVMVHVLKPIL